MKKDEQANVLLSLKNLYRLFTVKDYPVYSTGILGEKSKKGLTLVRFWDEYLLYEWKSTRHGKMIFRKDGSQNRYHSEFCNRKESFPLYHIYIEEVLEGLNAETFGSQVLIFEKFLKEKNYNHSVFVQKLRKFLGMVMESDPWLSQECGEKLIFWIDYIEKKQKDFSQSFGDAWLFTLLSLHAMAGPEISGAKMKLVRNREDLKPEYIWSCIYQESGETRQSFLTLRNCELFRKSVKASHFFGREEELYDLKEMFFNSGKYLISGIGGIGKTELMRQLVSWMEQEEVKCRIAAVQYEENLAASFSRSFLNLTGESVEERFHESIYHLSEEHQEKTVLLLDNMNHTEEEDPYLSELKDLPCTIFVTSRQKHLDGFTTFGIKAPQKSALSLIFRDNYNKILSREEKDRLSRLLEKEIFQHPLTLKLLGKAGTYYFGNWDYLEEELQNNWNDVAEEFGLIDMYRGLYKLADIGETGSQLARMFALLPYQEIDRNFTVMFFQGFLKKNETLGEALGRLVKFGWLEDTGNGYRMHPVIAESLCTKDFSEAEFQPFWERAQKCFFPKQASKDEDPRMEEIAWLVFQGISRVQGAVSDQLVALAAEAARYLELPVPMCGKIRKLEKRCAQISNETKFMVACLTETKPEQNEEYIELFREQLKKRTLSSEWMLFAISDFCNRLEQSSNYECYREICDLIFQQKDNIDYKIGYALLQTNMQILKLNVKKAEMWAERGILMCVQWGHSQRILDFLYQKAECHMFLQEKEKLADCLEKIEQIQQIQRKRQGESEYAIWQLRGQLAAMDQNMEEAAYCMEQATDRCKMYCGEKNQMYSAMSEELARMYNAAGRREESLACHLAVRNQLLKNGYREGSMLLMVDNNMSVVYLDLGRPEEAIPYLTEALELTKENGLVGSAVAEPTWNLARVYRALGDEEKEDIYLKAAVEGFRECYPPEHPKRIAAEQRLKERQGE